MEVKWKHAAKTKSTSLHSMLRVPNRQTVGEQVPCGAVHFKVYVQLPVAKRAGLYRIIEHCYHSS